MKLFDKYEIVNLKINDERYPENLRQIYNPPQVLYCVGNISLLKDISIAIIGCRNASLYGKKIGTIFAENLSKNGVTVVSGFARGIDSIAHMASYKNIGRTIAVLGSGLNIIYPRENENLFKDIINNNGLIISEYPLNTAPNKENFPMRNRIISGLSSGVLVIEAKRNSGTMITVNYALEQGKNVFVVPGNIDSINSTGTNDLIKEGAQLVTNYKEIMFTFNYN